jgi:ribosome-associated toxin RatA of RatAB toxin-antitoxin module
MVRVERSALMPYTPAQLLALVQDVSRYPDYLPGCVGASVQSHDGNCMRAELRFRFAGLTESFLTENTLLPAETAAPQCLQMRLLRGPFKSLSGEWRFQPLGDTACKVSLMVALDWGAFSPGRLLTPHMARAVDDIMRAFKDRAATLHG